jgi:aminopeptidase N
VFSFIAHETSHQWWGNIVAWRSYRDQWLSEGFAEYSGMLYTGLRDSMKSQRDLIEKNRYTLRFPPETDKGVGKGKVAELGPLILGQRLRTRNSINAYQDLIYAKGALVLRMLHYLFSDPNSGSGQAFFDMMADFVKQYQNKAASTEDFAIVANQHFANTPIGKMFGLKDLNWFFQEWVMEAKLPSYRMEYALESGAKGQAVISGTIFQDNAGPNWFMPLPVVCKFAGNQVGRITVYANGPQTPFKMALPQMPSSVELDPDWWILSEKTSTKSK